MIARPLLAIACVAAGLALSRPAAAQTPTPTPGGDCCGAHSGTSCDDATCASCVCGADAACCNAEWDVICVLEAGEPTCADACNCSGTPTPTATPGGDCCSSHPGTSCDVPACTSCTCTADPFCCTVQWDLTCAGEASAECAASCPCGGAPTDTPTAGADATPTPTPTAPCPATPRSGCQPADAKKSLLVWKRSAVAGNDRFSWRWRSTTAALTVSDLGDPIVGTDYTLCVYAGSATAVIPLPAGAAWQRAGRTGYRFSAQSPSGSRKAKVAAGSATRALVIAKGAAVPSAIEPPLSLPVTVQLGIGDGPCFSARYDAAQVLKNDASQFRGKGG
jgi:hypothetical protein